MLDSTEKPGVEERYQGACNTSDLRVREEATGPADVIIAAGWSASRLGLALLRLHSEWAAAAKPTPPGPAQIAALSLVHKDKKTGKPNRLAARNEAARWYANELRILAVSLKSRPAVWEGLGPWLQAKGISHQAGAHALMHWLSPTCDHCSGHGLLKEPDAPVLSARQCRACNATGTKPAPDQKVQGFISQCTSEARTAIKNRLHKK